MLKLGRKVEYALIAVMHLEKLDDGELATARQISEQYSIPMQVLGKVLQSLNRAGIVRSAQGVRGGYQLQRPLEMIVLGDVIEAVEGPVHIAACTCTTAACDQEPTCNIRAPVFHFQDELQRFLYNFSLAAFERPATDQEKPLYPTVTMGATP
jgi:Rrf2 family protein